MAPRPEASGTASVDPRVRRTKEHVRKVTRELLEAGDEALTLTLIAERAEVTRQTLYTHWGTVDSIVADTIVLSRTLSADAYEGLATRARAELFFRELIETLDPAMAAATASIMASMQHSEAAFKAFDTINMSLYAAFLDSVGPVTHDQFVELVSPVLMMLLPKGSVSEEMIASLSERAEQFLS